MKTIEKRTENDRLTAVLEIEKEEFDQALEEAYLNDTEHFPVPGYAAGLAPREEIEKIYGEEALWDEALNECIPLMYSEFLDKENIRIIGRPEIKEISHFDDSVTFSVLADLYPSVKIGRYSGLKVREAEDEDALKRSVLKAACEGMEGDASAAMIESKLDSLAAHEKLKITGDPIYHLLADTVEILDKVYRETGVSRPMRQVRSEAMDIMLQTVSSDNKDLSAEYMKQEMTRLAARYRPIPDDMGEIMEKLFTDRGDKKAQMGADELAAEAFDAYLGSIDLDEKKWRHEHREAAVESARCDLLLEAVAEKEKLQATKEEINAMLSQIAENCGVEMENVIAEIDTESVRQQLLRDKACRLIIDNAKITKE